MTPQTIVGLVLLVLGVAVKVAAAAAWLPGDVSFIGEITNLGVLLLGKELMPASAAAAQKRTSLKPPAGAALLVLPLLFGCAGSPRDAALQNRLEANALREDVNEAAEVLAQAYGALPFICAYFGEQSAACMSLQDGYRITASAIDTVHRGIDLLDAVGVGAEQTRVAAERVLSEAKAFGSAVQRTGDEVQNAVAKQADGSGGGPGGPSAEQPAAEAAPAEGAGPPPAAAP
jgi:hypothetical protein